MSKLFPESFAFVGHNAPVRLEVDIGDLEIEGTLPDDLKGRWYRCGPDPQFAPFFPDDNILNGDGVISSFTFGNNRVDFKRRYIHTERFLLERAAGRALFGAYRNPYTDDPSTKGCDRTTSNTTPLWHAGKLLTLKEDGRPYEIDPVTLATRGRHDFGGKLKSLTVTAHPKVDADTGELFLFGYEADGEASTTVSLITVNADGTLRGEQWFPTPYAAFMHDFAVTKEHIVFFVFPTTVSVERMKAGGSRWAWDPSLKTHVGVMPRNGSVQDLRWFSRPPCFAFHVMNAFSEGSTVHVDFCLSATMPFPFIPNVDGSLREPGSGAPFLTRWSFDPSQPGERFEERRLSDFAGDMPSVAHRHLMKNSPVGYWAPMDPSKPMHLSGPGGPGLNTLARIDLRSGEVKAWHVGDDCTVQEPLHVPSLRSGHEGYLLAIADVHSKNLTDAVILEAEFPERGPVARIRLPMRLRNEIHGCWVAK